MKKINGLSQKPHPYQISAYILFSILVLTYFLITFPLSTPAAKIVGGVLEALTCLIILTSGYIVTATDPSDSLLLATLKARAEGNMQIEQGSEYMCSYDRAYVHETSKHCKRCGRCTEGFDHHCKWINNDIGKKNYKSFIVLISSVWFFLLCFLVFGALVTANYVTDPEFLNHEIFLYMNQPERILTGLIILWVIKGLSLLLFALTTNLVLFHLFLIYKGLTTYQYLTLVQERRDNKREMTVARKAMGDKKKTCLDFIIFLGRSRKQQKDKQEGTKKKKQKSSKDQIPNQNPANSETKKNKKAFVPDNDPEQDPNGQILTSDAYSANREHLKTEEQVLLSSSPNRNARFIVSDPMRKISSDKLMRPGGGESPTNLAPLEDNPSEGCVNELNYETYQIKQHTPKDRRETASTSIEKKKKLFLNLEGLDQLHIRKSAPSNQSAHQQHQYYSFDKSKSQNEVPSLVEADLGETNGNKQDNIKLMSYCDHGKSKFVLKGLESLNKIQTNTVQESQDLESQTDRKEENKTKYQEVSIENL